MEENMSLEVEKLRPNIRIEIHNNLSQDKMEVDDDQNDENEDGEIQEDIEDKMDEVMLPASKTIWPSGVFTTGINVFNKDEQEKLQERAKRFALKPDETYSFSDEDLQELYKSLGINENNESDIKSNMLHLFGINGMDNEDILGYYAKYAPDGIEWIDNNSCNIVWLDNISAARALFYTSKAVRGMPARDTFPVDFIDEDVEKDSDLLKNRNREVELREDEEILSQKKAILKNSVDILDITIPIPPGYWRLSNNHAKTKSLLVRFALKTDKKPYKSEKFAKYYKKLAGTNLSSKNVISDSKKKELRSIFERNKELYREEKNPWGSLAKNWDKDAKFREKTPEKYDDEEPKVKIKNTKILARLGVKRKQDEGEENFEEIQIVETKKNKMPRMKMYADEEEEKIKRKKILQTIKLQSEKIEKAHKTDLRNVLGYSSRVPSMQQIPEPAAVKDLGTKLKNRTQKLVFAVEREPPREKLRDDVRSMLSKRRDAHRLEKLERSREIIDRVSRVAKTLHSDRMHRRHRASRHHRSSSYDDRSKPKSKVAVVIKTQKKPVVASTVWSRVTRSSESGGSSSESISEMDSYDSSSSHSSSSDTSSDSDSNSDAENDSDDTYSSKTRSTQKLSRPGFNDIKRRLSKRIDNRTPLKITMSNEHYRRLDRR